MLIEIGAVGRVLGCDSSSRYIKAEFEYTVPHKLASSAEHMLCIYPLLAKILSAKIRGNRPLYPYGCRLDDPGNRVEYYISPSLPRRLVAACLSVYSRSVEARMAE
jgi:hypothetical protein